jgi:hypothetical protein
MKTAVTIPWEAVVEGCPPSQQAKALPLVVSRRCAELDPVTVEAIARSFEKSQSVIVRGPASFTIEVPLPCQGLGATLTSDGQTSVIVQAVWRMANVGVHTKCDLRKGAVARTYVGRYARLNADDRRFVAATRGSAEDVTDRPLRPHVEFLRAGAWGFADTPRGRHWTGDGMFASSPAAPARHRFDATRPRFRDCFDDTPDPDRGDPFLCLPQLRQYRDACENSAAGPTSPSKLDHLCHLLAIGVGRCRLFGIAVPAGEDFTLSTRALDRAMRGQAVAHLHAMASASRQLADWMETTSAYAHLNLALDLLEARMDAHVACLALDEAYAAALYDGSPEAPVMSRRLTQVRRLINVFDGNLKKNLPLLRLAASTYLLDNWRRLLAPAHRDCPPWWLDGCIG